MELVKHCFEKFFTLSEANQLIPRLEVLMRELQSRTLELRDKLATLDADDEPAPSDLEEIVRRHPVLRDLAEKIATVASEIETEGCLLKDIDMGLVDFPSELDDEVVFLCWQFGEQQVSAWHSIEDGFASRQPLSGTRKPYLN